MQKVKKIFQSSASKNGSYSVGITVLVIAIAVILNLIFGQLPEKYRNIDVSSTKIYEISETSKSMLKDLEYDIKFTVLADKSDTDERIKTFLSKYTALSKKIDVEWIDPVLHPSALDEYEASENSIVVECEETGRSKIVYFDSIIVSDDAYYYYTGESTESEFDGEGQLSSAVNYVTSDVSKKIYRTSGHGESTLSSSVNELMDKNNYTVEEYNTVMNPEIPNDCDLLIMYAPTSDMTEDEVEAVRKYLSKGGNVMILFGDTNSTELPNIDSLMKEYGMESVEGYIADMERCYQGNYYYIFPQLYLSGDLADGIETEMTLIVNTHGMTITDPERETISVEEFMTTSDNSYAVTEESQSEAVRYTLGAVATESVGADSDDDDEEDSTDDTEETDQEIGESRLTVISAGSLIDESITAAFTQLENTTLFMNAVSANFDDVQNLSIEAKSLEPVYNTMQHAGLTSIIVIFVIPLIIIIAGFVAWVKRRKA